MVGMVRKTKIAKNGWSFCFYVDMAKNEDIRFIAEIRMLDLEKGHYGFFIYGDVKDLIDTSHFVNPPIELTSLYNKKMHVDLSIKHHFLLTWEKNLITIPTKNYLKKYFWCIAKQFIINYANVLVGRNEGIYRSMRTDALGDNYEEIIKSLKQNIQNTKLPSDEDIHYYTPSLFKKNY